MEKALEVSGAEEKGMMELFGSQVIQKASDYAQELKKIIDKQELFTIIGTNKHVHVEGWTTLGALLRVFPDVVSTERIEVGGTIRGYLVEITRYDKYAKKDIVSEKFVKEALYNKKQMKIIPTPTGEDVREVQEIKYKSRVELVTLEGKRFGGAFAICSNLEEGKLFQDESDIASMSETRATGKVFRLSFSWVMKLAGYSPTIPEEMQTISANGDMKKEAEKITPKLEPKEAETELVADEPKTKFNLPADLNDQKSLWIKLITEGKGQGSITSQDIDSILKKGGASKPPSIRQLVNVLPLLWELIESKKGDQKK